MANSDGHGGMPRASSAKKTADSVVKSVSDFAASMGVKPQKGPGMIKTGKAQKVKK